MKVLWIIGCIFFAIGLAMLIGSASAWRSHAAFAEHAITTDGTVDEIVSYRSSKGSTLYKPRVQFTTESGTVVHFSSSVGSGSTSYRAGDKVRVLYDPALPQSAQIDSFLENWFVVLLLGGMGMVFTLVGGGLVAYLIKKRRVRLWVEKNGMRVKAQFLGVEINTHIQVNGRCPWALRCQWQHPVSNKVYVFVSEPIWFDPTPYVTQKELDVLVNADDPTQYEVDLGFLPKTG